MTAPLVLLGECTLVEKLWKAQCSSGAPNTPQPYDPAVPHLHHQKGVGMSTKTGARGAGLFIALLITASGWKQPIEGEWTQENEVPLHPTKGMSLTEEVRHNGTNCRIPFL